MTAKREIEFRGSIYKVRSNAVEIPDLDSMESLRAAVWVMQNTYPRGYSRAKDQLPAISVVTS